MMELSPLNVFPLQPTCISIPVILGITSVLFLVLFADPLKLRLCRSVSPAA